jgi:hypothetical protein
MSHDDPTPTRGNLTLDERLERIEGAQTRANGALDAIKDAIAGLPLRVRALEIVVYGGCGVALIALLGALIALVLKQHQ